MYSINAKLKAINFNFFNILKKRFLNKKFFLYWFILIFSQNNIINANTNQDIVNIVDKKYSAVKSSKVYVNKFLLSSQYLNTKNYKVEDIIQFVSENPTWITRKSLYNRIEFLMNDETSPKLIYKWFSDHRPKTINGRKYFAISKLAIQKEFSSDDINFLIKTWIKADLKQIELINFAKKINSLHLKDKESNIFILKDKISKLNFIDESVMHQKAAKLISKKHVNTKNNNELQNEFAKLTEAYKAIIKNQHNLKYWQEVSSILIKMHANKFIPKKPKEKHCAIKENAYLNNIKIYKNLSNKLKNNSNIIFLYLNNHYKFKQLINSEVEQLILKATKYEELHEAWWDIINCYARELILKSKFAQALALVNSISINAKDHPRISEAQIFLQGFLNYKLDKFERAQEIFEHGYKITKHTRYKAKFSYWRGLMYQNLNKLEKAKQNFEIASQYGFTFYGQVACNSLNKPITLNNSLIANINPNLQKLKLEKQYHNVKDSEKIISAILHSDIKKRTKAHMFIDFLENFDSDLVAQVYFYKKFAKINSHYVNTAVGNAIMNKNNIFLKEAYPTPYGHIPSFVPHSVLYSIIRQESEFDETIVAHDGGMGLMQIMSYTGKKLSNELKVPYDEKKLLLSPQYIIKLGSFYLANNLKMFNNNLLLTFYSYNSGENKVQEWVTQLGDLSKIKDQSAILEWLESVTFNITRWYGQRVMENYEVYEYLLNNKKIPPLKKLFK